MTIQYEIRSARLIDLDPIVNLWSGLISHHRSLEPRLYQTEIHAPASYRAFVRRKLDDRDGMVLVADRDGEILGYLLGGVGQRAPVYVVRSVGMIFDLMVMPDLRRQGVGRRLVETARTEFGRLGIHDIQVNFAPMNGEATAFWAALGFETLLHEAYLKT